MAGSVQTFLTASPTHSSSRGFRISRVLAEKIFNFENRAGQHGKELWSSDGTSTGTQLLWDMNTTPVQTNMYGFGRVGGAEYVKQFEIRAG